jgi:hypothetical protein
MPQIRKVFTFCLREDKAGSAGGANLMDPVRVSKAADKAMPPIIQAAGANTSISRT